jgi:hypothetical protein
VIRGGMEDFLSLEISKVHSLIPNFKACLVVKINDIWVSTTKKGFESGFGKVRFENLILQEVPQLLISNGTNLQTEG